MNYDDYKTGLHDDNSPVNYKYEEQEQITIDEAYYYELNEAYEKLRDVKKIFKEWYKLNSFPLEKTSDEKVKLAKLENELIKILL